MSPISRLTLLLPNLFYEALSVCSFTCQHLILSGSILFEPIHMQSKDKETIEFQSQMEILLFFSDVSLFVCSDFPIRRGALLEERRGIRNTFNKSYGVSAN
jgi:hypothetical protein